MSEKIIKVDNSYKIIKVNGIIDNSDIESKPQVSPAVDDLVLIADTSDNGLFKKVTTQAIANLISTFNRTITGFRAIFEVAGSLVESVRIGNTTNKLAIWANNGGAEMTTENGSRIRLQSPLRFDAVAGQFTINRMPIVIRCETDAEDNNAKGTFIEWDQLFRSGITYDYGIAESAYRNWIRGGSVGPAPTFTVATTGQKRVMWFGQHYESAAGTGEATHMHGNWETCQADMSTIVTRIQVGYGEDWTEVSVVNADFAISKNAKFFLASDKNVYMTLNGTNGDVSFMLDTLTIDGNTTIVGEVIAPKARASSSAGLIIEANNGTDVADFGAGNTANSTFYGAVQVPDDAYDATSWNGNTTVPTKNAIRDKIEVISTETATFTNKRVTPRTGTIASAANPTINTDLVDFYSITALAGNITSMTTNLSGTPTNGQRLWIAITGTAARTITWGASFEASTIALPTTTVLTNRLDVEFIWNAATSKWRCVRAV